MVGNNDGQVENGSAWECPCKQIPKLARGKCNYEDISMAIVSSGRL